MSGHDGDEDGHDKTELSLDQLMFLASSEAYAELLVEMMENRLRVADHDVDTEHALLLSYIYDQLEIGKATAVSLANMLAAMTVKFAAERMARQDGH